MKIDLSKTSLGIEFGSTRIKAVLINELAEVIASGTYNWENKFDNNFWTYSKDEILVGLSSVYNNLNQNFYNKYNAKITKIGSIGISAMMHGYIVLDENDNFLTPFRTWRNNNTEELALKLTNILNYQIPARWSISHLYYAIENNEKHIHKIKYQTTLAGYVHYLLTNEKVLGINDASGMFPIDPQTNDYLESSVNTFDKILKEKQLDYKLKDIFPKVLNAGTKAGNLTEIGAKLLDPTGSLKSGIMFAPPEGDAATGMVSTNTIANKTGNVSAGTSIFSMIIIDKPLSKIYPEVDIVNTPHGKLVAMIHANNCTSDLNAWIAVFKELLNTFDANISDDELYEKLFLKALEGEKNVSNMTLYNYLSGENITKISKGMPLFIRNTESTFNLSNFIRLHLYSAFATLKIGMDLLIKEEKVEIDSILGHGGIFKTKDVAQTILAAALNTKISVNETANEGGPYGMALLAQYLLSGKNDLERYLNEIFTNSNITTTKPNIDDVNGFNEFLNNYIKGLDILKLANKLL